MSTWVQTLLTELPDITFAIIHLFAGRRRARVPHYAPPPNVARLVEWPVDIDSPANIAISIPQAKLYHALSTGFAGLLGCQIKAALQRPLILTEHGIYWREVEVGADELECGFQLVPNGQNTFNLQPLRNHWTVKFKEMARQAYQQADIITTVCQANAQLQAMLAAPPTKCRVIPNSVNWQTLWPQQPRLPAPDGVFKIGFVGRVVSIKNVLTFIQACHQVNRQLAQVEFFIIGPLDHDPAYAAHCRSLVTELGLSTKLTFTGETDPTPWYHRLDVVVLTSLSEAQPLVLLEAMAAGTPVVAPQVGGCPELILGAGDQDKRLGAAGQLTPVGDPQATANAILALGNNAALWGQASRAGQKRVRQFYSTRQMAQAYLALYQTYL